MRDRAGLKSCLAGLAAAFFAAPVLLPIALPALGQGAPTSEEARQQLEKGRRSLDDTRRREAGLEQEVAIGKAELEQINRNLIDTAKLVQRSEGRLSDLEARLGELEAQEKLVRGSLEQNQGKTSKLLAAMQRMGRNPPPVMVTRREDALQMVRSAMLLASVFPELREQALTLADRLNELARVMTETRKEGEQLRAETQRMADARARLDMLLARKRDSLIEQQGELRKVRQAAADLARSISELDDLIAKLDKTVAEQAGIEAYNRQLAEAQAQEQRAAESAQAPAQPRPQPPPPAQSQLPPLVVERQPSAAPPTQAEVPAAQPGREPTAQPPHSTPPKPEPGSRIALANPGRLAPAVPFAKLRGRLPLPAAGKRLAGFGEKSELGGTSKGIALETRPGAQITSPSDGWVVFAQEFRSYGQLLIINAGGGYHVVLAGLTRVDVTVGQFVLAGEPVAVMGSAAPPAAGAARAALKAADAPPALYIEIRKDGRPIDPEPWWAAEGAQRAQG